MTTPSRIPAVARRCGWLPIAIVALAWPARVHAQQPPAVTQPGPQHEALARFIGEWDVEVVLTVPGSPATTAPGHATYEWLIPGYWIGQRLSDELFGQHHESFAILGYDNYAKSYVVAGVSSFDTSLNVARGPAVDPDGNVIVTWGLLDEYLTGELHKPYRIVTRIIDDDHHVVETWDMGRGAEGVRVIEYRYARVRGSR